MNVVVEESEATERQAQEFRDRAAAVIDEVGKFIVGQREIVRDTVVCLIAGGNVLIEGVPGLGKTVLVRALGWAVDLRFSRIQFTPDLMPADITGTNVVIDGADGQRTFRFEPGPVFANLVLADEINRATPKTQAALLEAMQERQVTVARDVHVLPPPFFVMATQNPIEMEGTYPLPEAQVDRFMFKLVVTYPSAAELTEILDRTTGADEPEVARVATGQDLLTMGAFCAARGHGAARWALRSGSGEVHTSPRCGRTRAEPPIRALRLLAAGGAVNGAGSQGVRDAGWALQRGL